VSLLSALLAEQGFKDKLKPKTYISLAKAQVSRLVSNRSARRSIASFLNGGIIWYSLVHIEQSL
jgi:hypothetical protein